MLVAFSSPVTFTKSAFSGVKFRAKFEVALQNQFLSVAANHSKSDFSTVKWVYSSEIPSNIATIREGNSTATDSFFTKIVERVAHRITRHYSAELLTAKQTLTTSKNLIKFTHSDFPCHLKVNRDKLALISRLWKCKIGERLTITANLFTKIVDYRSTRRIPPAVAVRMRKFRPLQEPIRLQDLFNSARSRAQKKIIADICYHLRSLAQFIIVNKLRATDSNIPLINKNRQYLHFCSFF